MLADVKHNKESIHSELQKRVFGLDILRSLAIILVLVGHLGHVGLGKNGYLQYLFGFYGVELFFVLSGFLIGQILIRLTQNGLSFASIRSFWMKRWLRTLPLYYLVLVLRIVLDQPHFPYLHFIFLQNSNLINNYDSSWFGESWSLTIEEFFYLIIPLILWILSKIISNAKWIIGLGLLAVIGSAFLAKVLIVFGNFQLDFESDIRKFTFVRLDSLSLGVLIAFLKIYSITIYKLLQRWFVFLPILMLFILLTLKGNILVYDFVGSKMIPSTIGIILNSLLLALMIPFFDKIDISTVKMNWFKWLGFTSVHYTALFSYCIYLIHLPIYHLIITEPNLNLNWLMQSILAIVIIYGIGAISYFFFEQPLLKLRSRLT